MEERIIKDINNLLTQLFQKMHEAGYEWDAENKELKKIEQKPNPYSGTSFEYNGHTYGMCARDNGVDILIDSKLKTHVSLDTNQNPAWSEEDEEMHRKCICAMRASACGFPEEEKFVEQVDNWLKSLKERVQPQPKKEWSEDTQQWIDVIIKDYEDLYDADKDHRATIQAKINILKSLRPQSQWRPSEEMLEALYRAIPENTMAISEDEMLLDKLYQGLKYGRVLSNK